MLTCHALLRQVHHLVLRPVPKLRALPLRSFQTTATLKKKNLTRCQCHLCGQTFDSPSILRLHLGRRHAPAISEALLQDPVKTYTAIFGNHYKSLTDSELRYSGGLVVTLQGEDKGKWFSFTQDKGGGPMQAVMMEHGFSYEQAVHFAAELSGLSRDELEKVADIRSEEKESSFDRTKLDASIEMREENRIKSAQAMWEVTEPLKVSQG